MLAEVAYAGESEVAGKDGRTELRLFPNLLRDPACLRAQLADPLAFRDALLALHDTARSELFVSAAEIERRIMDPVVTVARHSVFLEAFSRDESTYGRVTLRSGAFAAIDQLRPGSTNVDFSAGLRSGIERLRSGSTTSLVVDPGGIEVHRDAQVHREERIDLPDGWVHGFLAVQSSMRAPGASIAFHPADFRNLVTYLRGRKETVSPRSLRFRLSPGAPPCVIVEPWNEEIVFSRSTHEAQEPAEIRIWGRRRLLVLARALPGAKSVRALLQGSGLPSFWTLDLGAISLTLGLSPWSERDWTADAVALGGGAPEVAPEELDRAGAFLTARDHAFAEEVGRDAGVTTEHALEVLDALSVRGRVLYDPDSDLFFPRRLFVGDPPPPPAPHERRAAGEAIASKGGVKIDGESRERGERSVRATVKGNGTYAVTAVVDDRGAIVRGACGCPFFARFGIQRGACKHLLAVATKLAAPAN